MSTIAIIGASGYAGGNIAKEALNRGYEVIAISRTTPPEPHEGLTWRQGDLANESLLRELAAESSTIVIAVHGAVDGEDFLVKFVPTLLDVAAESGTRLGFVGGAGSLFVSDGGPRLFDTPEFPDAFLHEAKAHAKALEALRDSDSTADWFYISPAAGFGSYAAGERTGHYRTGDDVLVTDESGTSFISGEDYAIAFLDEIENPTHSRSRFGVAY
jgi:putative NADH-flavin reductase